MDTTYKYGLFRFSLFDQLSTRYPDTHLTMSKLFNASRFSHNTQGIIWVVGAMLAWALVGACNKVLLTYHLAADQLVFGRALMVLLMMSPLILRTKGKIVATNNVKLHLLRGLFITISAYCNAYAVTHLSLAEANAFLMSASLFMLPLGWLFLAEKSHMLRWIGVFIGFIGVLMILRPDFGGLQFAAVLALTAAMSEAMLGVVLKKVSAQERSAAMIFWSYTSNFVVFGILTRFHLPALPAAAWGWFFLAGIGTLGIFICYIKAYRIGDASAVEAGSFSLLLFSPILGYVFFDEIPPAYFWSGSAVMVLGIIIVLFEPKRQS
ncbi:DMT family transporter [Leeia oryzae]|uniref:DMT family transporter n=1 Tax=Leeia oryzae TaxID=356662 RepID=UPI000362510E|nr:DMT family transporter [Leeia oryzae]